MNDLAGTDGVPLGTLRVSDAERAASLVRSSFLGRPEVADVAAEADDQLVAAVLAGLDDLDRRVALERTSPVTADSASELTARSTPLRASGGAADVWCRELDELVLTGTPAGTTLVDVVASFGVPVASQGSAVSLVLERPSMAQAIVEKLGGRWEQGNYARLYRAARIQAGLEPSTATPRRSVSGFATASLLGRTRRDVLAPIQELPQVRGRDELIATLVDGGLDAPPAVLVGAGGHGKSTLALAAARVLAERGALALWVAAPDRDALAAGLEQVAIHLGVTASELEATREGGPEARLTRLWSSIDAQPHTWVLVLDDVGPAAVGDVAWLHHASSGRVIVTSRHGDQQRWGPAADVVPVGPLEPEHGAFLLLDRIGRTRGQLSRSARQRVRRLSTLLVGSPLALCSVGTLVASEAGGTLEQVVARVGRIVRGEPTDAVGFAYEVGMHACGADERSARTLMRLLACFAPDEPLPVRLLDEVHERWCHDRDGLDLLCRVGLVETVPEARCDEPAVRLHPAVAEHARRDAVTAGEAAVLDGRAIVILLDEIADLDPGAPAHWPAVSRLEPHVAEALESPALAAPDAMAGALRLADVTAEALMRSGHHGSATTMLDRALGRFAELGPRHPAMLSARRTRAWMIAIDGGGDLPAAETLLGALHRETRVRLGPEDETTLAVQDCLAWVKVEQGDLATGRALFTEVLAARRERLGDRHPDTLATRHRLAWVAAQYGDQRAGLRALESVLTDRRALLGAGHLDVFSTLYRLGWALNEQGRHAESERVFRELLTSATVALGTGHPLVLMIRGRLAWSVGGLNRFDEAERMYLELLADQERVLGPEHPRLNTTRHFLGALHSQYGRVHDAELELRGVVARRDRTLGPDHLLSLESRSYHGWALFLTGRDADAERYLESVLADRTRVLGPRHPDTLLTCQLLARVLLHRGRIAEAEKRMQALLADTDALPPDHRITLRCRVTLAIAGALQGRVDESTRGLREVIADRTRLLGREHRETLAARDQLSWVLSEAGLHQESETLCEEVLIARRRLLGDAHPDTLTSRYRLASLTMIAGRHATARRRYTDLLVDLRRHLEHPPREAVECVATDRHPDTLRCRLGLLQAERLDGDLDTAATSASGLIVDLVATQGEDAVATMRAREELVHLTFARGDAAHARRMAIELLGRRRRVLGAHHPHTRRSQALLAADTRRLDTPRSRRAHR